MKSINQLKIGIIGGGQLGKMMILAAKKMNPHFIILDPHKDCPAASVANEQIIANFDDHEAIRRLVKQADVVTYEFEHIDAGILMTLENEGNLIYPTAKSLTIIQNKYTQKKHLQNHAIPVPLFIQITTLQELIAAGGELGYPFVLKTCTGGYDGKGNAVITGESTLQETYETLGNGRLPLMAEAFVPFIMEVSVLACRSITGETAVYPVAQNIHKDHILDETIVPADISQVTQKKAMAIAGNVMNALEGVGMFCVEMFITENGNVLVNEVAPRPHNSGHYTIEACITSQFEQHIRAICGLPLGNVFLHHPAVMKNLLAPVQSSGVPCFTGIENALKVPSASLHIYGKETLSPKRKMGHITAIAQTTEEALENARTAYNCISIKSI